MGRRKFTYNEVKEFIESEGYKLLSKEYVNSHSKILVRCPEGHEYWVKYYAFKQGKRCAKCRKCAKWEEVEVKEYLKEHNCEWVGGKYKNNHSQLILRCSIGHTFSTTLKSFKRHPVCKICWKSDPRNNPNWRGGVWKKQLPLYDTYAPQLEWCEEVRRDPEDKKILQVRCYESDCRRWFTPKLKDVTRRVQALKDNLTGEQHFYCSEKCKQKCSVFRRIKYPRNFKDVKLDREVQPELRELVFERDGWICQKCGSKDDLQCHHILPVKLEPLESADVDNCITLCRKCHIEVHQMAGCTYGELKSVC